MHLGDENCFHVSRVAIHDNMRQLNDNIILIIIKIISEGLGFNH